MRRIVGFESKLEADERGWLICRINKLKRAASRAKKANFSYKDFHSLAQNWTLLSASQNERREQAVETKVLSILIGVIEMLLP